MGDKPLSKQEKDAAKEIFEALDGDGDGKIDHDDMKKALANAGHKLEDGEIDAIFELVDPDNSGSVSFDEYMKMCENRPIKKRIEAALRKLFEAMDADGSGFITVEDLKTIVKEAGYGDEVSDEQLEDLVKRVDTAGDGKVSFDEFVAVFLED